MIREKICIPCQGGIPPLPLDEIKNLKKHLAPQWKLIKNNTRLRIVYTFKDFARPMELAVEIGNMADQQWHHPELTIGYGHLDVAVWTHKINGLVESDFIFCAKVDHIYEKFVDRQGS